MIHRYQSQTRLKSVFSLKSFFIVIFAVVVSLIIHLSKDNFSKDVNEYKKEVYQEFDKKILSTYQLILKEKEHSSFLLATSVAQYETIKKHILSDTIKDLDLQNIIDNLTFKAKSENIELEIISKDGMSLKKSWSDIVGDNAFETDYKLKELIKKPKPFSDIIITKYGISISHEIPLYKENEHIGFVGLHIHFDEILEEFSLLGLKSIVLLNEKDSYKIIQDISYSQNFIENIYVGNKNADAYMINLIKEYGIKNYFLTNWEDDFKILDKSGHLVIKLDILDHHNITKGNILIFQNIEDIELKNMKYLEYLYMVITSLIIIFIAFCLNFIYAFSRVKVLEKENRFLTIENDKLMTRTEEMDYKDKKIDNLFNMQPNIMIMHNGKRIIQGNRRFVHFFKRFNGVAGFLETHGCISELFHECHAPNYICEPYIEGKSWIDYILSNPKRLYKIIMPYKKDDINENHHFIVKINEMTYSDKVGDRLIIIALVDITQDLENYKSINCD